MTDDLPPPPPGFSIVDTPAPPTRRTTRTARASGVAPPPPPPGFQVVPSSPAAVQDDGSLTLTGDAHDGDTFRLSNGRNTRLYGADAYELNQTGRGADGSPVPLGVEARNFARSRISPSSTLGFTGQQTYGRPVASVTTNGEDVAKSELTAGLALATPQYLRDDPQRLHDYMEAERLARMNFRGGHGTDAQNPSAFRHNGAPGVDPWAKAEDLPGNVKGGDVVWWDQPTPFQGLRPDIEKGYTSIFKDMSSKPADLLAFAKANGFTVDPAKVAAAYAHRAKYGNPNDDVSYDKPPRVLTDLGDGNLGAAVRGVADPFNVLDEVGGLGDALLPNAIRVAGQERENVWNSKRRFGDILANNIEQNRQILDNDAANHGWARFGGQMAGGLVVPGASVEGVGLAAARSALRSGATRFAAERVATRAIATRLGAVGAGEAGAAGFGSGETLPERFQNAAIAAPLGGVLGVAAPFAIKGASGVVRRALGRDVGEAVASAAGGETAGSAAPSGGPVNPVALAPAATVIDMAGLRAASADASGFSDMGKAGNLLRSAADTALADGRKVTLHIEGRAIPITKPGLVDETGQRWGAMNILSPKPGDNARLEIEAPQLQPSASAGTVPPPPAGFRAVDAPNENVAAMGAEHGDATLYGPDMVPPPPTGFRVVDRIDLNQRPRPMLGDVTEAQRAAQGQRINPGDVLPLPDSAVASMEEADAIGAGMRLTLKAPNEDKALGSRSFPSPADGTKPVNKRGPLDLVTWLRTQGAIKPQGGELEHYGIDNTPRKMDFTAGENRLGKLVDPEGMPYDEAAQRAHEAGFFPDKIDRPSVDEFLDALHATHTGRVRSFRPDDYAEVDQFNADREARHAIEAAKERGAPMVADRGQPVDMADLDRNAPPVHAYEDWGDQAPDFAGNIRLSKLDSPQAIKRALTVTHDLVGGFDAATRGRVTQAETKNLASELGMTPADLLARRKGQAFNAEEALAARQILAKSANELVNMAKRINGLENPGDEAMASFREAWTRHVAIQEQVAGATAEAGRALQQFRMDASSRAVRGEVLRSMAEGATGPNRLKDFAARIVDMQDNGADPGQVNKFVADALKPKFSDKLVELYYNSILSGPTTHVVNIVGNTMTALGQLPEHAIAAGLGAPRARLASGADRVLFSELGARAVGLLQGTKEGMAQAARTFVTGRTSDLAAKVDAQETHAISGIKGTFIRTPTRALSAEDELFKAMARRMELSGLAMRQAKAEGLNGAAARTRAAELIANPSDDLLAKSFDYGRYLTFQRQLGPVGQGISRITQAMPLLKLVVPFVRTPTNILKFALERSPAAPLLKEWRADIAAGGARRDLATARILVGSGVMALSAELVSKGLVTGGGPADENAKALMRADGWQPYSLKIGDKYYSYQRLDPYSTTLGIAADFADLQGHMTDKQKDAVAGLLLASTLKNLGNKTWFSGLSSVSDAVNDPTRYGASYIRSRLSSIVVPAIVSQTQRSSDPVLRDAKTLLDSIRARAPWFSRSVAPRRDVFGREVRSEGGVGPDILSPFAVSTAKRDPVVRALLDAGAHVSKPVAKVRGRDLTPQEYERYQVEAGASERSYVSALVGSPDWRNVPTDSRKDLLESTVASARREARERLFGTPGRGSRNAAPAIPPPPPGFALAQ